MGFPTGSSSAWLWNPATSKRLSRNDKLDISFPTKEKDTPVFHKPLESKLWIPSEAKDVQSVNYRLDLVTQHSYLGILMSPTEINAVFSKLIYWMPAFVIIHPVVLKRSPASQQMCWWAFMTSPCEGLSLLQPTAVSAQRLCVQQSASLTWLPAEEELGSGEAAYVSHSSAETGGAQIHFPFPSLPFTFSSFPFSVFASWEGR